MKKEKLAQMVLQKMKLKKQKQQANRPHHQVLQLLVKFQIEHHTQLQSEILHLQSTINKQSQFYQQIQHNCMRLESTGKKQYPRFLVQPNFIASENIGVFAKEFYRKASNTFLREDLLRKKKYEADNGRIKLISEQLDILQEKIKQVNKLNSKMIVVQNEKRVRNLKQDLRLRAVRQQIQQIKAKISTDKNQYAPLIKEYQLKKQNLHNRIDVAHKLLQTIQQQKSLIRNTYNPETYRQQVKRLFDAKFKNELMRKNLRDVKASLSSIQTQKNHNQRFLERVNNLFIKGRCPDSSNRKRRAHFNDDSVLSISKLRNSTLYIPHSSSTGDSHRKTFSSLQNRTAASSRLNSNEKRSINNSLETKLHKSTIMQ